jgi:hypothetical protein
LIALLEEHTPHTHPPSDKAKLEALLVSLR